jgi:CHAT domain-containing protein/Tfp pilus assembly protein PilF
MAYSVRKNLISVLFCLAPIVLGLAPAEATNGQWRVFLLSADSLCSLGECDSALVLARQAYLLAVSQFGPTDTVTAKVLYKIGSYQLNLGKLDSSRVYFLQAATLLQGQSTRNDRFLGSTYSALAAVDHQLGNLDSAEQYANLALETKLRMLPANSLEIANTYQNLGLIKLAKGETAAARESLVKARHIQASLPDVTAQNLAEIDVALGNVALAEENGRLALPQFQAAEQAYEQDSASYGLLLAQLRVSMANAYQKLGQYQRAQGMYLSALDWLRANLGEEHPEYLRTRFNLSILLVNSGQFPLAEEILEDLRVPYQAAFGPRSYDESGLMLTLGLVYTERRRFDRAEEMFRSALAIQTKVLGDSNAVLCLALNNLASLFSDEGRYEESRTMLARAYGIVLSAYGKESEDLATILETTAELELKQLKYDSALVHLQMAEATQTAVFGGRTPRGARMASLIADIQSRQGLFHAADSGFENSLGFLQSSVEGSPKYLPETSTLYAQHLLRIGNRDKALVYASRAFWLLRDRFQATVDVLSERDALRFATQIREARDLCLECLPPDFRCSDDVRQRLANILLASHGMAVDAVSHRTRSQWLLANAGSNPLIVALQDTRVRLARTFDTSGGIDARARSGVVVDSLIAAIDSLEELVGVQVRAAAGARTADHHPLDDLLAALPDSAVYVSYDYFKTPSNSLEDRRNGYALMVATRAGIRNLAFINCGVRTAANFRLYQSQMKSIAARGGASAVDAADYDGLAKQLYADLWSAVERFVPEGGQVLISTDDVLNGISMASLKRSDGTYLVEHCDVQMLGSALPRVESVRLAASNNGMLAMGAPDFDAVAKKSADHTNEGGQTRSSTGGLDRDCYTLQSAVYSPLPGASEEVAEVADIWRKATGRNADVLVGAAATKSAFASLVQNREVVHVATHGYYVKGTCFHRTASDPVEDQLSSVFSSQTGLVFSGANRRTDSSAADNLGDGLLSSQEVLALDLRPVQLVVLSACMTATGDSWEGEGIFDLRRAFLDAGSHAVIGSLWGVPDRATKELMADFYRHRSDSDCRSLHEAIRDLIRIKRERHESDHPFDWGAFVYTSYLAAAQK